MVIRKPGGAERPRTSGLTAAALASLLTTESQEDADEEPAVSERDVVVEAETASLTNEPSGSRAKSRSGEPELGPPPPPPPKGRKPSAVWRHTEFYCMDTDRHGKPIPRRRCRYCDSDFAFKGSTTTAALRHLRRFHAAELQTDDDSESPLAAAPPFIATDSHRSSRQSEESSAEDQEPDEDDISSITSDIGNPNQDDEGDCQVDGDRQRAAGEDNRSTGEGQRVVGNQAQGYDADVAVRWHRAMLKRRLDELENSGDTSDRVPRPQTSAVHHLGGKTQPSPWLTDSQVAIMHFLQHHRHELTIAGHLKFAKHLTKNSSDAEMYNVLDNVTRLAYIREFGEEEGELPT